MDQLTIFLGALFILAFAIYLYVWYMVRAKRRAMRIITIPERRLYQTSIIAATAILFSAFIAMGTVLLGGA